MVDLPDTSFKKLANARMTKEGRKVESVLNQMYQEREL